MILKNIRGKLKCSERHCTHSAKYELIPNAGMHGIPLCVKHLQVLKVMVDEVLTREAQGQPVNNVENKPQTKVQNKPAKTQTGTENKSAKPNAKTVKNA